MQQRVLTNEKIQPVWDSVLEEVLADESGRCRAILVKNLKTGGVSEIPCKCVFVAIGHTPNTKAFAGAVELDSEGYIKVRDEIKTSVEGVYAAGDCADKKYRQAITAAASGCKAAIAAANNF